MTLRASASAPAGQGRDQSGGPYFLLVIVALGALLAPLNSTMLAVALPEIRGDFGVSHAAVGWLFSSYLIAMAVTQPVGGRLGDQLGRVRVFRIGLVAFVVFSVAAAVAPHFWVLVLFRTLQAIAGAILIPNGIGMLRVGVPSNEFGKFSGFNSSVIGSSAALGPLIGGALLLLGPWRLLFLLNAPLVLAALVLAWSLPGRSGEPGGSVRVDFMGFGLFAALLGLLTWLLNAVRSESAAVLAATVAALVVVAGLFVRRQMTTDQPAATWALFRRVAFVAPATHILLMNLAMYTTLLAIPFFIVEVQGRGAVVAGLLLACMAALQALTAPFAGRVSDAIGRRTPTVISSISALAAALMLLFGADAGVPLWYLAVAVTILGLGVGIGFVTATVAAVEAAPRSFAGSAAGTQSMMRYCGSIIGVGLLTGLLSVHGTADVATFRFLFGLIAGLLVVSLIAAWYVRPFAREEE